MRRRTDEIVDLFFTKDKGLTLGCQSGSYDPPAPCFDFMLMSSAISLLRLIGH